MRISRMTVDKLGVRLYDTVSAVVAELIANGYDADADKVTVKLPLATSLAKRGVSKGEVIDASYLIEVIDDGHGMTPQEARDHFLQIGRERRNHPTQGTQSRKYRRPVMGRKGIGKLAPFGICRRIEVISAGGVRTRAGYIVSHFVMDYDQILKDSDEPVILETGSLDRTYKSKSGTTIRLTKFLAKRVPDATTFLRQLARRFSPTSTFEIVVVDTRPASLRGDNPRLHPVGPLDVPIQPTTKIDLSSRPVITEDGEKLHVSGWLALAKDAYKDEETTGVRIYARKKIVGWTRDFEQPAGYTGEFTMRSYLVGEVTAEWLDLDEGDDLVRTDRQGIIWDSEYGNALRNWGAKLIKEMGSSSRGPRRERVKEIFLRQSGIEERAQERFVDHAVVVAAMDLAQRIGGFAAEDELTDKQYVDDLSDVILTVAPHTALMKAFQEFEIASKAGDVPIEKVYALFGKTRVAELASYGQIAHERVRVIEKLQTIVFAKTDEDAFQKLIADAPWLIEPTWSVISENQSLVTFKGNFEKWYKQTRKEDVVLAIRYGPKRPDFTLVEVGHKLHVVEIKASEHVFNDKDWDRLVRYLEAFDEFFRNHESIVREFPGGYQVTLVADGVSLQNPSNRRAFEADVDKKKIRRVTWVDFLTHARSAHQAFLATANRLAEHQDDASSRAT
jgi:Histidine kinase-, DNA gyrase B-, and HSP90-like ATPase